MMLRESREAPERVREQLQRDADLYRELGEKLRERNPSVVGTIARGSSDHAASYAAYLIPQCTGRIVASIPPSVITVLRARLRLEEQFVLALSQSGGSPDLLAALEGARAGGALSAALINTPDSLLGKAAHYELPQRAGPEKSITATKSVLCTLSGIARLCAEWAQDRALLSGLQELPALLETAAAAGGRGDPQLLRGVSHAFVLSRGLGFGAATELALKCKETCGLHAEAFSAAELRHGPREIVNDQYLVIALALPGSGEADVLAAAAEMKGQGARVLLVAEEKHRPDFVIPSGGESRLAPLLALQLLYPWIALSAKALGRDPDKPRTLVSKVIRTT